MLGMPKWSQGTISYAGTWAALDASPSFGDQNRLSAQVIAPIFLRNILKELDAVRDLQHPKHSKHPLWHPPVFPDKFPVKVFAKLTHRLLVVGWWWVQLIWYDSPGDRWQPPTCVPGWEVTSSPRTLLPWGFGFVVCFVGAPEVGPWNKRSAPNHGWLWMWYIYVNRYVMIWYIDNYWSISMCVHDTIFGV